MAADYKQKLTLDASSHNSEFAKAAEAVKKYDNATQSAEQSARRHLQAQHSNIQSAKAQAAADKDLADKLGGVSDALGLGSSAGEAFAGVLSGGLGTLASFGTGLGALALATKVATDAFFASEATLDEWGATIDSSKSVYEGFLMSLNNGDFSSFLSKIDEIVDAAREAYSALDDLNTFRTLNVRLKTDIGAEQYRFEEMLKRGRYIAPLDGRKATMKDGQELTPEQIARLRVQLSNLNKRVTTNARQEYEKLETSIEALTKKKAAENNIPLSVFKKAIESPAGLNDAIRKGKLFNEGAKGAYTHQGQVGAGIYDPKKNKYHAYKDFANFVNFKDGSLDEINKLLTEREALRRMVYGSQSREAKINNTLDGRSGGSGSNGRHTQKAGKVEPSVMTEKLDIKEQATSSVFNYLKNVESLFQGDKAKRLEFPVFINVTQKDVDEARKKVKDAVGGAESLNALDEYSKVVQDFNNNPLNNIKLNIDASAINEVVPTLAKQLEEIKKKGEGFNELSSSLDGLGNSLTSLGGKGLEAAGAMIQTTSALFGMIGQVMAFGGAKALSQALSLPFPANIPAISVVTGLIASSISLVGGIAGKFAQGGIVGGTTTVGDYNLVRVNAGEMILNGSQQAHLFNLLKGGTLANSNTSPAGGTVVFKLNGNNLVGVLSNHAKKNSRV